MLQAGVGYLAYELPVDASLDEVKAKIHEVNNDPRIHGILIQRPLPEHLDEAKVMASVNFWKHIEAVSSGEVSDIAADSLTRFLTKHEYHCQAHHSVIQIAGFGNIITHRFCKQIKNHYKRVIETPGFPEHLAGAASNEKQELLSMETSEAVEGKRPVLLVTELHRGPGYITGDMIPPEMKVIIDLGNYVTEKGVVGDVNPAVFEREGLALAPTPGGLLPVLLWVMMERTIRAKIELTNGRGTDGGCFCQ